MKLINRKRIIRGFTLIELLVVISIIGILSALLMANFSSIRERARDVQRKSDLKQIQKALELYKNSQTTVVQYPQTTTWATMESALKASPGNYMKTVPVDPINAGENVYYYGSPVGTDDLDYALRACLENKSDKGGIADAVNCPISGIKFELNAP